MTVLAIDIGGTKFAAALVRPDGSMDRRTEVPVGPDPTATLASLVREVGPAEVTGVGIGSAGPVDVTAGRVSPVNIPAWRDFPLADTVGGLVPAVPVALAGDGQCMALGEWWRGGHGPASRALLGIVVSTGVGGGVVLDGEPYLGPTGNAGHIGHITVDRDGEPCPCGATGCLETIASGPSMVRWALANGWRAAAGHPDARALASDAARGIPVARLAFQRAADALATAILTAAALFDLDEVVVGGGVSGAGDTLLTPLRQAVAKQAGLGFLHRLTVTRTALERDAGLYGAAALVLPREVRPPAGR
ncbi:glucokinase [Streptosporangium becharense]|uniref:Glucokinase n=1 Tax=Streptosporangium becharense TaxID=1816182 RepID=A0A7W9IMK5_9ACTN|nr:ROK family protein [Streptosporangium becharense]MBB2914480.1 glucokinase [Streptosporangium becharense]MBB5823488.1 glucokinase [Streptosporangium becharense]